MGKEAAEKVDQTIINACEFLENLLKAKHSLAPIELDAIPKVMSAVAELIDAAKETTTAATMAENKIKIEKVSVPGKPGEIILVAYGSIDPTEFSNALKKFQQDQKKKAQCDCS